MTRGGLPHSDIPGSKLVCSSPGLFAACHVLHRLLAPRHSPYTLSSLTIRNSKLTRTNRLHVDWSATVPCNTALPAFALTSFGGLMLWSEKTTVCRIFSCQRSACRNLAEQSVYVGSVWRATRRRHRTWRPSSAHKPAPDVGVRETQEASLAHRNFFRLRPSGYGGTGTNVRCRFKDLPVLIGLACQPELVCIPARRRLVENTGLEPVTSWLQTRRSPS